MPYERVQVMLRPEERDAVRRRAERLGISMSEVIREALEPVVSAECEVAETDPLFAIFGIAGDSFCLDETNPDDDVDEVVYGDAGRTGLRS
jgi:Ribbon-helix-helix protein, copG family